MNIENSIATTLFSSELGGAAAISGQQGLTNIVADSPEGSLFQQLINQMLTGKNLTGDAASGNLNTGGKNQTGGTADMLSQMLLAGGNLSKLGIQKTGNTIGESAEIKGASSEPQTSDENAGAMEMLQAMMAGMTNTATAANVEKAFIGIQTEKLQTAAINSIGNVPGNPAAIETLKQMTANASMQSGQNTATITADGKTESVETAEGTTAVQLGIRQTMEEQKQMLQTGSRWETTALSSDKAAAEKGIMSQETGKTALTNDKAEKQTAFQSVLTPKAAVGNQTAASETQTMEDTSIPAEKSKLETESDEGIDPGRTGFQNSIQGAMTTSDVTDADALAQPVQSPEPYSQIREEILSKLEQNGPTEFKMQLQPEDLGQIDIKLKLSEGKLVIDILAADSRTQALLTSQVDKLISSMGLQNVHVESVQVSQQMNSQTQDNSQSQGFTMNSAMDFSQRRQQEQSQQASYSDAKLVGRFNLNQDETQTTNPVSRISAQYDSHRMNYSV